jgi:hypothetical protein
MPKKAKISTICNKYVKTFLKRHNEKFLIEWKAEEKTFDSLFTNPKKPKKVITPFTDEQFKELADKANPENMEQFNKILIEHFDEIQEYIRLIPTM